SVPDDFSHVIKWGALADLFGRGVYALDVPRQQYCESRWALGARLLTAAPALLAARIQNVGINIDSVRNADLYRASWEALAAAQPDSIYHAGLNLVALA